MPGVFHVWVESRIATCLPPNGIGCDVLKKKYSTSLSRRICCPAMVWIPGRLDRPAYPMERWETNDRAGDDFFAVAFFRVIRRPFIQVDFSTLECPLPYMACDSLVP